MYIISLYKLFMFCPVFLKIYSKPPHPQWKGVFLTTGAGNPRWRPPVKLPISKQFIHWRCWFFPPNCCPALCELGAPHPHPTQNSTPCVTVFFFLAAAALWQRKASEEGRPSIIHLHYIYTASPSWKQVKSWGISLDGGRQWAGNASHRQGGAASLYLCVQTPPPHAN